MKDRYTIACFLFLAIIIPVSGQIRIPQFDIEAKGGYSMIDAGSMEEIDNVGFTFYQVGAHVQISQRIALGGFYNRSVSGEVKYGNDGGSTQTENRLDVLMYGVDLRLSAGRSARWRPYFGLVYGKGEFVEKAETYNLAATSTMVGVNLGIMKLFGRNFYWNILEVSTRYLPDRIFFLDADFLIEAKTGFTYNIRIKNK